MVEIDDHLEKYEGYNKKIKRKIIKTEEKEELREDLNIWETNPSYKDISNKFSIVKVIVLLVITICIIIIMYLFTQHLIISIGVGVISCIGFILVFHDEIYLLRYFFRFFFRNKVAFTPFEDIVFWYKDEDTATLFMSNKKDLVHVALRIYQIQVIAENIHPAIIQFVKALSSKNIRMSYSYQIVQKPVIHLFNKDTSRNNVLKSLHSRGTTIYFSVFKEEKGILTNHKLDKMQYFIGKYSNTLKSNIVSNFHHFQAVLLSGNALMNAVRTFYLKEKVATYETPINKKKALNSNNSHIFWKFGICAGLVFYFSLFLFFFLNLLIFYIICINLVFIAGLTLLWWRSLLFQFTKSKLIKTDDIIVAKPFANIQFYRVREFPYSIFFHIENRLLIGMKLVNLKHVYNRPFCLLGKFIESLNNHKVNFSYTLKNQPLSFYDFYHNGGKKYLTPQWFYKTRFQKEVQEERWLGMRYGMWFTMLTMSANSYKFVNTLNDAVFSEMEEDLISQVDELQGAFDINFQAYEIEVMRTNTLISGYIFSVLKQNLYRLNGTHLNYVMFQGAYMYPLTEIVDVLKKGVHIEIAAEFNTPLYLENFITIGHTFNTEVLETEVAFGFTREQLHNLLIMNGTSEHRDLISMKIMSELIKAKISSIVFDFAGEWSRLLPYFDGTEFKKDILYFKYGSSFIVDPIKSDIPYDPHNADYLESIYDAFGLALKRDERIVEMFRQTIQKNPDMDLGSIQMALQNQTEWEKTPVNDLLLTIFTDFTPNEMTYFQTIQKDSIVASDFVKNNKTVIIDLSVFRDLKKKMFVTFVILSKIGHYIQHHEDYYKKTIYVPYIDNIFDSYFLDLRRNYDKVDIFLKPFVEKKFGLIFSAHQIHYLHSNALLYFNNYMTLRTTDTRDIAMLRNIVNLQELEGIGIYSSKRKHSHQINYLKNLKHNTIITRRDDIDQPFPAIIDWKDIQEKSALPYEEIVKFMDKQGFNLKVSERKILEQARESLFEIDLGHYYIYVKDIIKFVDQILIIDQIGNLYRDKIKKYLKQYLYPTISEKTQNKQHLKRIIENVLEALIKHGYLVENHPRRAGGGEALRTSYSVGSRYQEALEDYYKVKGGANRDFQVEVLERERMGSEDLATIFPTHTRRYVIQKENLIEALSREIGDLYFHIFKIYRFIDNGDYSNAIKIQHGLIKNYLMGVYRHFYNVESVVINDFNSFLGVLGETEGFPFSKQKLIDFIDQYQVIKLEDPNLEPLAKEIYQYISTFFGKIQYFINKE